MFCPGCGKEVSEGDAFCRHCGHSLSVREPAPAEPPSTPPVKPPSKRKGLTVKIAVGVFLGVMAALIVYSLPGRYRKHQAVQQAKRDTDFELYVMDLTPEKLIAVCGKPLKDKQDTSDTPATRTMTYDIGRGDTLDVFFFGEASTDAAGKKKVAWNLDSYSGQFDKFGTLDWARSFTVMLPCAFPRNQQ